MSRVTILCIFLLFVSDIFAAIQNKGWWQHTVFYEVYPRSFMDSNNDGIGDLKGITSKMSYFVESGIGGIWLSPIYASPMAAFGYDISDFRDVYPDYGTMQDLKDLIAEAKRLGIKVIMDLIPNHTSDKHEWFRKSVKGEGKYTDYYVWKIGKNNNELPPNNWISVYNGSAWTATKDRWYLHQFDYRQPDLNYDNPEVHEEMDNIIKYWLRKGINGFHVHAVSHLFEHVDYPDEPPSYEPGVFTRSYKYLDHIYTKDDPRSYGLIVHWRNIMDNYADYNNLDEIVMMTEAYTNLKYVTRFYQFGSHVPFNLKFVTDVNKASTADDFKRVIDEWIFHTPTNATPNWVIGNHDCSRIASRYPGKGDQMIMLQMVLPGIAITYNGEEIGMVDKQNTFCKEVRTYNAVHVCNTAKSKFHSRLYDPNRTPFQWDSTQNAGFSKATYTWLPVHNNYRELNLINQRGINESYYKIYTTLTKMRLGNVALYSGHLHTLLRNNDTVLVVIRQYATESVVFLMNFDNENDQIVDLTPNVTFPRTLVIKVASMNSSVKTGIRVHIQEITVPSNAALVVASEH